MAGRDGEDVPDQHLGEGEDDSPAQDVDKETNLDDIPPHKGGYTGVKT